MDAAEVARIRDRVRRHFDLGGSLDALGIAPTKPEAGTPFAIISRTPKLATYSVADHSNWRRCSYCQRDRQFADGSIVACADGHLRLIGDDCWGKHIQEEDWATATLDHADYRRRVRFEALREQFAPAGRRLQASLKDRAQWAATVRFVVGFPTLVRERFPSIHDDLIAAARTDQLLQVERFVPVFAALEGRGGQRAVHSETEDFRTHRPQSVALHRLSGAAALVPPATSPAGHLDAAFRAICRANQVMSETDWEALADRTFVKTANEYEALCAEAVGKVESTLVLVDAVDAFLGAANTRGLVRWANDADNPAHLQGTWRSLPHGIELLTEPLDPVRVVRLSDFRRPEIDGLTELRRALTR